MEQQAVTQKQRRQLTAEQDALEHMKSCTDKPFLEEKFIDPFKGFYLEVFFAQPYRAREVTWVCFTKYKHIHE